MCLAIVCLEQQRSRSHHGILLLTSRFLQTSSTYLSQQLCHSLCWAFRHWKQGVKLQLAQYLPEVGREHRVLQGHSRQRAPDVQLAATAALPNHTSQMYGLQVGKKQGVLRHIYPCLSSDAAFQRATGSAKSVTIQAPGCSVQLQNKNAIRALPSDNQIGFWWTETFVERGRREEKNIKKRYSYWLKGNTGKKKKSKQQHSGSKEETEGEGCYSNYCKRLTLVLL